MADSSKGRGRRAGRTPSHLPFKERAAELAARGARNPDALAAYIGDKKYGKAGMAAKAAAGRKKAAEKRKGGSGK